MSRSSRVCAGSLLTLPSRARLSLEEISEKFGDDVAVHITDASQEEREKLDLALEKGEQVHVSEASPAEKAV